MKIMPIILAAFSLFLLIGSTRLDVANATFPGPGFFPTLLGIAGLILAGIIAVDGVRNPHASTRLDYRALAWSIGGFLVFALSLEFLGWIIAGALLFWTQTRAFNSPRPAFDILISFLMSSLIYLAFDVGLDLNLPSGLLGGGF